MAKVNECDLKCPVKAMLAAEYRQETEDAGPLRKLSSAAALGIVGVGQVARAISCRRRDVMPWQPHGQCEKEVRDTLSERPLNEEQLTEYELRILAPYLGRTDQPPVEEM
jgi:hypothetical protein